MGRSPWLFSLLAAIAVAAGGAYSATQLGNDSGGQAGSNRPTEVIPSAGPGTTAADSTPSPHGKPSVASITDPEQAAAVTDVLHTIATGGRLPYDQDGAVFENREGNLPELPSGEAYHEYTVPTPGSPDRGARRLVISTTGLVYYTADHYETFTLLNG